MSGDVLILVVEAVAVYLLVLGCHALRHRFGLGPFYAMLGALTAVMSWVTDAGMRVDAAGLSFMVGSTVFYSGLLLGVFMVYVFDGPPSTRLAILTVAGVSAVVPLIAGVLHAQARLAGLEGLAAVPVPSLRINTASVVTTIVDLLFLAMAWEFLGKPSWRLPMWLRAYLTLLGVLWLDVVLFSTGAFAGTAAYGGILTGTLVSRLAISLFAFPFLLGYLNWQNRVLGSVIESRPVLAILQEFARVRSELTVARREIDLRRRMEEALRTSERRYRELYENAPVGIFRTSSGGRAIAVNPAMARMLECATPEEATHRFTDLGRELYADPGRREEFLDLLGREGTVHNFEYEACTARGRRVWLSMNARVCGRQADGSFDIEGFTIDVTGSKEAVGALERSERRWKDILVNTPQVGVALDPQGRVVFANEHLLRLTGWTEEEVLGRDWFDTFIPEAVREQVRTVFHTVVSSGETGGFSTYENEIQTRDGALRNLAWSNVLTRGREGEVLDVTCLGIDLTERKRAEQELRERENLLERVFDVLPIGLWQADRDGVVVRGNPAGWRIWGMEARRLELGDLGMFKARRLPGGEGVGPQDWALARVIRDKAAVEEELMEIEALDGETRTILNSASPIVDEGGELQGAIVMNQDVTERRRAEEEKARLEEQYLQSQKLEAVGQLTGGVAHDFNNLLQVINGGADMALEDLGPGHPARETLMELRQAGRSAARLVEQLLLFSRQQIMRPGPLDLNEVVGNLLQLIRRVIGEHIRVEWMPAEGLHAVRADLGMIEQTIVNLCVNARDAMASGGVLTLSTENTVVDREFCEMYRWARAGSYVLLTVTDTGSGMAKETLDHVFEPFFTTKEVGKGTGLGLATVYGIVKQHGGMITAHSEPGAGATFRVYLPSAAEAAPAAEEPGPAPARAEATGTLLLAEDDPMVRNLTRQVLERAGYTVRTAVDGQEAVEMFRAEPDAFDAAVLDVVMPRLGGRQAFEQMRALRPGFPVVFASGYSEDALDTDSVLDEGLTLIAKPYAREVLLGTLREVMGRRGGR